MKRPSHHGVQIASCGKDFNVGWSATTSEPLQANTLIDRTKVRLPDLSEERKTWLARVDSEGEGWCDACDEVERFVKRYPSRFSHIGPIETIENPHFEARFQRLDYETIGGRRPAAFTGPGNVGPIASARCGGRGEML